MNVQNEQRQVSKTINEFAIRLSVGLMICTVQMRRNETRVQFIFIYTEYENGTCRGIGLIIFFFFGAKQC